MMYLWGVKVHLWLLYLVTCFLFIWIIGVLSLKIYDICSILLKVHLYSFTAVISVQKNLTTIIRAPTVISFIEILLPLRLFWLLHMSNVIFCFQWGLNWPPEDAVKCGPPLIQKLHCTVYLRDTSIIRRNLSFILNVCLKNL